MHLAVLAHCILIGNVEMHFPCQCRSVKHVCMIPVLANISLCGSSSLFLQVTWQCSMLFPRVSENNLLVHPQGCPVSITFHFLIEQDETEKECN